MYRFDRNGRRTFRNVVGKSGEAGLMWRLKHVKVLVGRHKEAGKRCVPKVVLLQALHQGCLLKIEGSLGLAKLLLEDRVQDQTLGRFFIVCLANILALSEWRTLN